MPGVSRFIRWQIATRLLGSARVQVPWIGGTQLILERGMQGATGNYYCGLLEYADMSFLLDVLRPDDLFVDVGANVGVYTVLASGVCGARTVALEPVDKAFSRTERHIEANGLQELVEAHKLAAGDARGTATMTVDSDTTNRLATGSGAASAPGSTATVEIDTLDNVLDGREATLIKIDVEGWELPVLRGAVETLAARSMLALIVEVNGASRSYGISEQELQTFLLDNDFRPYAYVPDSRQLIPDPSSPGGNVIFIKNQVALEERLAAAPERGLR